MRFVPEVRDRAEPESGFEDYSYEQLDVLESADVVIYPLNADGSVNPSVAATLSSPIFEQLPVARNDRVYGLASFFGVTDYVTALRALNDLEQTVLSQI